MPNLGRSRVCSASLHFVACCAAPGKRIKSSWAGLSRPSTSYPSRKDVDARDERGHHDTVFVMADLIAVILRCERQSREPRRMSGPNASAVALRGLPGVVLRGAVRSHLRMTPGLEPRGHFMVTE